MLSLAPLKSLPCLVNNPKKTRQWNVRVKTWELADCKNVAENYYENMTKLTKDSLFTFFHLQTVSKLLYKQYNRILLIKVIKQSKRKKAKENHTFFLNSFSVDQVDIFSQLLWVFLVFQQKTKNTTNATIRHSLFDNFPCLSYPNYVSLISSMIFRLKYAILFWNKMVEYLHRKERK